MERYTQLTQIERYQIYALKRAGHTPAEIARIIGRHRSTISRELDRNKGGRGWRPKQAQEFAESRSHDKFQGRLAPDNWTLIDTLLRKRWSPEQISGRLLAERDIEVSHEWIYQHVQQDKDAGGDLHKHLRHQAKRRKRYGSKDRRGRIPQAISIDNRPIVVDSKERIGDWEGDTVVGKNHSGALVTLVDRYSCFLVMGAVERRTSELVGKAMVELLLPHKVKVHTITLDNGMEFADHQWVSMMLQADIYFAHPYSSWERGLNENTNKLVRQYLPKSRDLRGVTDEEVKVVTDALNSRPRKNLGYLTPNEVFLGEKSKLIGVALNS